MKLADVVTLTKTPRWTKKLTAENDQTQNALGVRQRFDNVDTLFEFADEYEADALKGLQTQK